MTTEQMIGFGLIYHIAVAVIFYSMGWRAGKYEGFMRGRASGIKLGKAQSHANR